MAFDYRSYGPDDATELRKLRDVIVKKSVNATRSGVDIGEAFIAAKKQLPHGSFGMWCEEETQFSARLAQLYINLALLFQKHGDIIMNLPLSAAIKLAAPSVAPEIAAEVLMRASRGKVKVEEVEQIIRSAKKQDFRNVIDGSAGEMADLIASVLSSNECWSLLGGLKDKGWSRRFSEHLAACLLRNQQIAPKPLPAPLFLPGN
jgi:hypothetical protein